MTRQGCLRALPTPKGNRIPPTGSAHKTGKTYKACLSTLAPTPVQSSEAPAPRPLAERGEAPVITMQLLRQAAQATPQRGGPDPGHSLTCTWAGSQPWPTPCGATGVGPQAWVSSRGAGLGTRQPVSECGGRCGHWPQASLSAGSSTRTTLTVSTESRPSSPAAGERAPWKGGGGQPLLGGWLILPTARPQHGHPFRRAHEQGSGNISHQRPGDPAWPLAVGGQRRRCCRPGVLWHHRSPR